MSFALEAIMGGGQKQAIEPPRTALPSVAPVPPDPTAKDWAKAQATDLLETGKRMIGMNDPVHRGGTYEPFKNTKEVARRAIGKTMLGGEVSITTDDGLSGTFSAEDLRRANLKRLNRK